ncbi:glycosidase [Sinomonas susongensis]|uniref:pullulanase X25 domain-containing protein n=1 Tax=Sinomonas susongensis TaxID=1324851 RepID=UPI001108406A|nr:glycosidase [Sinomonas susongensis]
MAKNASEKLDARLKAVLDGLAEARWAGENPNAGTVLAQAVELVPFDENESTLLSGGIPRGHKALTTATAKLVKAGWMVKGRSGWSITDEGLRALVAFPTVDTLAQALAEGTPIPAGVAVPAESPVKKKAGKKRTAAQKVAEKVGEAAEVVAEAAEALVAEEAAESEAAESDVLAFGAPESNGAQAPVAQPHSVAIAGDFGAALGAEADWEPSLDAVQMGLDPKTSLWRRTVELPPGTYTFKIAINRSWDENYGAFGFPNGANHELKHDGGPVTIEYNHQTKDVAFS